MAFSTIAIDGPGASGKSVVGQIIAQRLAYRFIDTGAMYRALTWQGIAEGLSFEDAEEIIEVAKRSSLEIEPITAEAPRGKVLVNGQEITAQLHTQEVDSKVSLLARIPEVREVLVAAQRVLAATGSVVMAGRDIGSVVLPNADLKVYLDAPVEERARRRHTELVRKDNQVTFDAVLDELKIRDGLDITRSASPLKPADDALIIDTEGRSPEEVAQLLIDYASSTAA